MSSAYAIENYTDCPKKIYRFISGVESESVSFYWDILYEFSFITMTSLTQQIIKIGPKIEPWNTPLVLKDVSYQIEQLRDIPPCHCHSQ